MDGEHPLDAFLALGEELKLPPREPGVQIGCLRVLGVADAVASKPGAYLLKGLLYNDQLGVVFGEPGCGKSFLMAHIAYAVAQGRSVFDLKVRQAPTLYLSLEGGTGFQQRVRALASEFGGCEHFLYVAHPVTFLTEATASKSVADAARTIGAKLIVIDTLARAIGAADENSSNDMGALIRLVDEIRSETGACLVLVHHTPKAGNGTPRGHSSLMGAADLMVRVEKSDQGGLGNATVVKAKDAEGGRSIGFVLRQVEVGADEDGDPITTCIVEQDDAPTKTTCEKLNAADRGYLNDIQDLLADPSAAAMVRPKSDMPEVWALTREQVRDAVRKAGRFTSDKGTPLSAADRQKFGRALTRLKDLKAICMTEEYIWLP